MATKHFSAAAKRINDVTHVKLPATCGVVFFLELLLGDLFYPNKSTAF